MKEEIILMMLEFQTQVKLQHWNTYGYSTHKAMGELYDELIDQIDDFVETMIGKDGVRPNFPDNFQIDLMKPEKVINEDALTSFIDYLISLSDTLDPRRDSDLLNDRDSIMGTVNQIKYLLTLTK